MLSRSSSSYVQEIRNSVGEKYMVMQTQALAELRNLDVVVLEIAFDETEEPITIAGVRSQSTHVMACHLRLFHRTGGATAKIDIVIPTVLLESTTAENLAAAVNRGLPLSLANIQARARRFALRVNTDSGAACLRLARHLGTIVPAISAPCKMHLGCLAMTAIFALAGFMSAIFCAALLLRRRRVQSVLRSALKRYVGAHLKVTYEPPSKEDREHASAVWDIAYEMIVARKDTSQVIEGKLTPRLAALRRSRRNLRGPLRGTDIVHYCPFGCHASQEEALL